MVSWTTNLEAYGKPWLILEGEFWDFCTVDTAVFKGYSGELQLIGYYLFNTSHIWSSFFLEKVRLSSLYIFPKLVGVVIGYCIRRELEKLPPKPSRVYFQANPATFWQGQRVKVVLLKVLVLVVY
ncbi:unnamed protein product [Prunus brigantina]